jgi:hypothetical protein
MKCSTDVGFKYMDNLRHLYVNADPEVTRVKTVTAKGTRTRNVSLAGLCEELRTTYYPWSERAAFPHANTTTYIILADLARMSIDVQRMSVRNTLLLAGWSGNDGTLIKQLPPRLFTIYEDLAFKKI